MTRYLVLIVLIGVFDFGQSLQLAKEDSSRQENGRLLSVFQVVKFQVSLLIFLWIFSVKTDEVVVLILRDMTVMMLDYAFRIQSAPEYQEMEPATQG